MLQILCIGKASVQGSTCSIVPYYRALVSENVALPTSRLSEAAASVSSMVGWLHQLGCQKLVLHAEQNWAKIMQ